MAARPAIKQSVLSLSAGTAWLLFLLCFFCLSARVWAAPSFQATGTAVRGTTSVSPAWPAHQTGDIALLFVETAGGQAPTVSADFVQVGAYSTGSGTSGARLTVFWARAMSSAMTAPTISLPGGNHLYAQILTYRGVVGTGNPWDVTGGGSAYAFESFSFRWRGDDATARAVIPSGGIHAVV